MQSKAATVEAYLKELDSDRREAIQAVRKVILKNLGKGFEEGMQYGMIGYYVPHRLFPAGYHCDPSQPLPFAGLASQKGAMSLYMMHLYGSASELAWFKDRWARTGKKLDMGKSCIRFKKVEDLPLDLIGETFARVSVAGYVKSYEEQLQSRGGEKPKKNAAAPAKAKPAKKKAKKVLKKSAKKAAGESSKRPS